MSVYHGTTTGAFDWAHPNERQQQVYLRTPDGHFSETWPLDECDYDRDMLPSEVLDLIEKRLDSYWISTRRRDETKKRIAACRERMGEFDMAWLKQRVENAEKELKEWQDRLQDMIDALGEAA